MGAFFLGVALAALVASVIFVHQAFLTLPAGEQVVLFILMLLPLIMAWSWSLAISRSIAAIPENRYLAMLVLIFGAAGSYYLYQETNLTPLVASVAATLATLGWILQRQLSVNMSRKQHTLNVLTQMRQSELFSTHKHNIFKTYPSSQVIPKEDIAGIKEACKDPAAYITQEGKPVYPLGESVKYVCNYYEFLASALREGDLDEALLKSSIESHFRAVFENFIHFIFDGRSNQATAYDNLVWLVTKHWKCCQLPQDYK